MVEKKEELGISSIIEQGYRLLLHKIRGVVLLIVFFSFIESVLGFSSIISKIYPAQMLCISRILELLFEPSNLPMTEEVLEELSAILNSLRDYVVGLVMLAIVLSIVSWLISVLANLIFLHFFSKKSTPFLEVSMVKPVLHTFSKMMILYVVFFAVILLGTGLILFLSYMRYYGIAFLLYILSFPFGIYYSYRYMTFFSILSLTNPDWSFVEVLQMSYKVSEGRFWKTMGLSFCLGLIISIIYLIAIFIPFLFFFTSFTGVAILMACWTIYVLDFIEVKKGIGK